MTDHVRSVVTSLTTSLIDYYCMGACGERRRDEGNRDEYADGTQHHHVNND
jgi:hypothetical protein